MLSFPSVCHQYPSSTDPKYTVFPVDTDKISFPQELLQQFRAVPASCIIFYFRSSMFIFSSPQTQHATRTPQLHNLSVHKMQGDMLAGQCETSLGPGSRKVTAEAHIGCVF